MKENNKRKFCVAPMMGYTTPYARNLYRILSKNAFLFTEMIASNTMIHSKNRDLIIQNNNNNPVSLQVGGSNIQDLKRCSEIAYQYNYDEINLNVGCPSKAVQKGSFGACLMKDKTLVRNCLEAMQNEKIEVSMKCRIGIGRELNYDFFEEFIEEILKSGIDIIYVHARNAILNGISPKANRNIPPLDYKFVKKIKKKFPNKKFILNGGINDLKAALDLSNQYDGVMLGRLVQNDPFVLKKVDKDFYGENYNTLITEELISKYFNDIRPILGKDSIFRLLSPLLQIFFGIPNSKSTKILINENIKKGKIDFIEKILLKFVNEKKLILN